MSSRGLAWLSALVAMLAAVVVVDRPARPRDPGESQRILAGLDPARVQRLVLAAPGQPTITLVRVDEGAGFALETPLATPADRDAVRDLLGTLEYLAWRRRVPAGDGTARGLGEAARLVEVTLTGGSVHRLRIGAAVPGLGRRYLADEKRVYLVDEYVAAALDRRVDELRAREPFASAEGDLRITRGGEKLVLRGDPPCVDQAGGCARADAELAAQLRARLARLSLVLFRDDVQVSPDLVLELGDVRVVVGGGCPGREDLQAAETPLGRGCVGRELAVPEAAALVDRRVAWLPLAELRQIELRAGDRRLRLVREGRDWFDATGERRRLDDGALADWARDVESFRATSVVAVAPTAAPPPGATVVELGRDDAPAERFWLTPDGKDRVLVVRPGDPAALRVHADVAALLAPDPSLVASREVVELEPSALRAVEIARPGQPVERAERGASLDDWSLTAPLALPADPGAIASLRESAAHLRALRVLAAGAAADTTVTLRFDPPPGQDGEVRVVLQLSPLTADSCLARRDGGPLVYVLDADVCTALTAPLASHDLWADREPLAVGGFSRQGPSWYGPRGERLSGAQSAALLADVAALGAPAEVVGYGTPAATRKLTITWSDGSQTNLDWGRGEYALEGRAVRYRTPTLATPF